MIDEHLEVEIQYNDVSCSLGQSHIWYNEDFAKIKNSIQDLKLITKWHTVG